MERDKLLYEAIDNLREDRKKTEELLKELEKWRLNETKFKQREFYRLQQIEYLHEIKQIDDNLFFCE